MKVLILAAGIAVTASVPALTVGLFAGLALALVAEVALITRSLRRKALR